MIRPSPWRDFTRRARARTSSGDIAPVSSMYNGASRKNPLCDTRRSISRSSRLPLRRLPRSEEHTSELQSLMRISYAVFCLKKKKSYKVKHRSNDHNHVDNHMQQYSTRIGTERILSN